MEKAINFKELDEAFLHRWDSAPTREIADAMQALYQLYDPEALVRFFASLWDGESGGFYYSHSARDHEGFAPDIESTYQILNIVRNMGAADGVGRELPDLLGRRMTDGIISFVQGMQSEEDGYFYHPQWRDSSGLLRVHRDQTSAIKILEWLGAEPKYATAISRADSADGAKTLPRHITDGDAAEAYVRESLGAHYTEGWSNKLGSQAEMWISSGCIDRVLDVLDEIQDPESGMWVVHKNENGTYLARNGKTESAYGVLTASYKVAAIYNKAGRAIKHPLAIVKNAIEGVRSTIVPATIPYLFNPWATLNYLRSNIKRHSPELIGEYDALIAEGGADMIYGVAEKLRAFRKPDASYSYYPDRSHPLIYGTRSSLGIYEGDVNGTLLGIKSVTDAAAAAFALGGSVPLFCYKHGELFSELCAENKKISKRPCPEKE